MGACAVEFIYFLYLCHFGYWIHAQIEPTMGKIMISLTNMGLPNHFCLLGLFSAFYMVHAL
jgi:hypothetical protein